MEIFILLIGADKCNPHKFRKQFNLHSGPLMECDDAMRTQNHKISLSPEILTYFVNFLRFKVCT